MRCLISFFIISFFSAIDGIAIGEEPDVRVLVPGFTVRPLPLRLTNVNNLAFGPDGRLFALTYDGRVLRLSDSDGDGLEDRQDSFWDKAPFQVPVGLAWSPDGLYVSSHGKVSLLRDEDGDGKAEREEVVSSGWPPTDVPSGGVDALGVTRDREGNIYFGLGAADYSNAYRVKDGKSRYDLKGERGTIIKLRPGAEGREIVATGIRFPYALRFNRHGDLFATDQEGETWLPGGNPLDELNHIVPGRHYGFPPRHESYLPGVLDEPPAVGFGPQHQSTCGMAFNEASSGWKSFGPPAWDGDAFVTGYSRGKLWRVRLVKTPSGYIGRPTLFATSSMLLADVALSPAGDLYLSCHSGSPDWGTGPKGAGRLFKVSYTDSDAPIPVAAWASGPLEVRVAFDRPLDPAVTNNLGGQHISFGEHVQAADRFEAHKPPYKAVQIQQASPRGKLRIAAATLAKDRLTLLLATDPHPESATYALTLPWSKPTGSLEAVSTIDLAYDLTGVEATWDDGREGSAPAWAGSWPHFDVEVTRALMAGSAEHERGLAFLGKPGQLTLRTRLLAPVDKLTAQLDGNRPFRVTLGRNSSESAVDDGGRHQAEVASDASVDGVELKATVQTGTGEGPLSFHVAYRVGTDPTFRPLPCERQLLPWVPLRKSSLTPPSAISFELAGGDPARGEALFYGEQARCSSCHKVRGKGRDVGPDLSNLVHRDAASVYRDISEPSAVIHPDYLPYNIARKDGRVFVGIVRAEGADVIRVTDAEAKESVIPRSEVDELQPSGTSIMPTGIANVLGGEKIRDLLAFLLTAPVPASPKVEEGPKPPPARTRAEVESMLGHPVRGARAGVEPNLKRLRVVLVSGPKDHGPGEHDYPDWQRRWKRLLGGAEGVEVDTADAWPERAQWERADLLVFYLWNHAWTAERYQDLDAFLARGGGVVALHAAVIADAEPEALAKRFGLSAQPVRTKYRHGALELEAVAAGNPITSGFTNARFVDETYWPPVGDPKRVEVLATTNEEGKPWPMLWTHTVGKGRVFCSVLGHYNWTFDDPLFRLLILRGMAWAAGEPINRFESLALEDVVLRGSPLP